MLSKSTTTSLYRCLFTLIQSRNNHSLVTIQQQNNHFLTPSTSPSNPSKHPYSQPLQPVQQQPLPALHLQIPHRAILSPLIHNNLHGTLAPNRRPPPRPKTPPPARHALLSAPLLRANKKHNRPHRLLTPPSHRPETRRLGRHAVRGILAFSHQNRRGNAQVAR